jgi:hypothetical protein
MSEQAVEIKDSNLDTKLQIKSDDEFAYLSSISKHRKVHQERRTT